MNEPSTASPIFSHDWYQSVCSVLGETTVKEPGLFEIPDDFLLSLVIPVYNEEKTIFEIVDLVAKAPIRKDILLIDDCSRDNTRQSLEEIRTSYEGNLMNSVRVFFHEKNQGKGATLRTSFAEVKGDVVIIQDADLEYDPNEYLKLVKPILERKADVVYGSRYIQSDLHRVVYFWAHDGEQIPDIPLELLHQSAADRHGNVLQGLPPRVPGRDPPEAAQNRFGFGSEVTTYIARIILSVYEIAIGYEGRSYAEEKKIGWRDSCKAIWCIVMYCLFAK